VRSERKIGYEAVRNGMVQAASNTLVVGQGRNPGLTQLQRLGKQQDIKNTPEILANLQRGLANRACFAKQAEVSRKPRKEIAAKINLRTMLSAGRAPC
jgi:hypothetical protein